MMKWESKLINHCGQSRIAVFFEKDIRLIARIKLLEDARWSQSKKCWHLPDHPENRKRFLITAVAKKIIDPKISGEVTQFTAWLQSKRYSDSTIKTYSEALKSFLIFFESKNPEDITNADIIVYNNDYILKKNLSSSYQNQIVNAVKLYFQIVRERKIDIDKIHRPKRSKTLPNVLSKEEVKLILYNAVEHQTSNDAMPDL